MNFWWPRLGEEASRLKLCVFSKTGLHLTNRSETSLCVHLPSLQHYPEEIPNVSDSQVHHLTPFDRA